MGSRWDVSYDLVSKAKGIGGMTKGEPHPLTEQILALRGKKSHGLIAKELGVTRNVVAGVCFREDHPGKRRIGSTRVNIPSRWWAKEQLPGRGLS